MEKTRKVKIVYKTTNEVWGKVHFVRATYGFSHLEFAVDFLIDKGFEVLANEQKGKLL